MTSKSIKELWRIEGKRKVKNILYGFTGNFLVPYDQSNIDPEYCIFSVVSQDGVETSYIFSNDEIDGERIHQRLAEFINNGDSKNKKLFYRNKKHGYRARINNSNVAVELLDLLISFRLKMTPEDAKRVHARLIDKKATKSFSNHMIYDLRWENIAYDGQLQSHNFIGNGDNERYLRIEKKGDVLCVRIGEECFCTEFSPALCRILNELINAGSWSIKEGALIIDFWKGTERIATVAFSEIVGTFFRGQIDMERPVESIIGNHSKLVERKEHGKRIVYDHLTHNKKNNFPWALAPMTQRLNVQMQGRDKIKPPYFFFTCYDAALDKYRVKLGAYGLWERRYLFDDLCYRNNEDDVFAAQYEPEPKKSEPGKDSLYATIYNKFKKKIGTKNMGAQTSYLSYWADPERVSDPENMLVAMLDEQAEMYRDALEVWLEDGESFDGVFIAI